jgi:hypothetical protein
VLSDAYLHELPDQVTFEAILGRSQCVYRCDRLHVFWEGLDSGPPAIYAPEGPWESSARTK